jgi:hypothetical protein
MTKPEENVLETELKKKPSIEHLAWAIEQRKEVQLTMLALYQFVQTHKAEHLTIDQQSMLNWLMGAAFSLWRAVFLAHSFRVPTSIYEAQAKFLGKVLEDNTITYPDDKASKDWTVGYYLENAEHRLNTAVLYSDIHLKTNVQGELLPLLRMAGRFDVELTQHEWESAHYVLRRLLKVIDPAATVEPVKPGPIRPKGLDAFYENDSGPK